MVLGATLNAMSKAPVPLRVFALKGFARFARRMHVSDEALWKAVLSPPDADLGGGSTSSESPGQARAHAAVVGRWLR